MSNFSSNQVRQFYAASAYNATVNESSAAGTIGAIKKVQDLRGDEVMFLFKGADTVLRSDLIQVKNIGYAKAIPASKMATKMRKISIALADDLVPGQDYVLSINFKNFFSSGDASQYWKDGAVHVTSSMSNSDFYKSMVKSLNAAFSREDGATKDSNPYLAFSVDNNTTATKIIIEEKPQAWELGTKKARRIMFEVFPSTIYTNGDDVVWAAEVSDGVYYTEETPTTTVGNGQQIADLEWFAAGERGDQYRNVGWPNVIKTKYLVDPTQDYHLLEIHYAFTDTGVNSYRTEKEITIAVPATANGKTALNAFISALNTATGLSIETLA